MRAIQLALAALLAVSVGCMKTVEPPLGPPVVDHSNDPRPPAKPTVSEPIAIGDDIDTDVLYSHGPTKLMMPEQILASLEALTGHEFDRGNPPYTITAPERARVTASYVAHCQAMGGCPDHVTRERVFSTSIIHALTLERAALEACVLDKDAKAMLPANADIDARRPTPAQIDEAIVWQYRHFFAQTPRRDEMDASRDYFVEHLEDGDDKNLGTALRGHCLALVTSAKFLYY